MIDQNFSNYELVTLIFSGIVTISTVCYIVLTGKLVAESRKMREFQLAPDISCYLDFNETDVSHMYLVIENIGLGTAQSVIFNIKKDFQYYQIPDLKPVNHGILKNGLNNFYPRQKFRYYITDLSQDFENKILDSISFTVSYKDILGTKYSRHFNLLVEEVQGIGKLTPPETYIGRIAYQLEHIRKTLGNLSK